VSGTGFTVGSGPPRLTYPVSGQASDHPDLPSHSATEDAEGELLPFALDSDATPASPQPLAPLRARASSGLSPAGLLPLEHCKPHLAAGGIAITAFA